MIHKAILNNISLSPYPYIDSERNDIFNLKNEYEFKPGINILIGKNGCGKTTLLNILRSYTLCNNEYHSKLPKSLLDINLFRPSESKPFLNGIDVLANYGASTYNLRNTKDIPTHRQMDNLFNFKETIITNNHSTGQGNIHNIQTLLELMFNEPTTNTTIKFPINEIINKIDSYETTNHPWKSNLIDLYNYYIRNNINDEVVTILMDEPEQNLDIDNLQQIYTILSETRPDTQIIASIHNPILIYRLSQLGNINIIEMNDGYLKTIINFIEARHDISIKHIRENRNYGR